ncbi:DUF4881 domain-containing protein [Desulfococcaceae bacterium OttesenSCG-928-F15]|nr:DUF4881 domain-containing protein [Desulfococcaceae bacterium OttesenSCG-928-F15]
MKHRMIKNALLVLVALVLAGCGTYGDVEQGRVVAYDDNTKTVTFIKDSGTDASNPKYEVLPPMVFDMPKEASETGPLPSTGLRMKLDLQAKQITMYDPTRGSFEKIPFELVAEHKGIDAKKGHPLLQGRDFPEINMDKNELTLYSQRQMELVTVKVPREALYRYKAKDWNAGDEVRIYFKQDNPKQILRFMNVSKTNIYKR